MLHYILNLQTNHCCLTVYIQCSETFFKSYLILFGLNIKNLFQNDYMYIFLLVPSILNPPLGHNGTITSHEFPVWVIRGTSGALVPDLQVFALNAVKVLEQLIVIHLNVRSTFGGHLLFRVHIL